MGLTQEDMGWTASFFEVCSVCLYLAEGKDSTTKTQRLLRRQRAIAAVTNILPYLCFTKHTMLQRAQSLLCSIRVLSPTQPWECSKDNSISVAGASVP